MHSLIIGRTGTGKTTLAKALVAQSSRAGRPALVCDPILDKWAADSIVVDSIEALMSLAKDPKFAERLLVVDESALSLNRYDKDELWLAKTSRHAGHASLYIGQDWVDVTKGIRTQCTQVFAFCCDRKDAEELARRFDNDKILQASRLEKFQFLQILSYREVFRGRVEPGKIFRER